MEPGHLVEQRVYGMRGVGTVTYAGTYHEPSGYSYETYYVFWRGAFGVKYLTANQVRNEIYKL